MRDGQQVGVKGFTARGNSDFTVVASNAASPNNGGNGRKQTGGSQDSGTADSPAVTGGSAAPGTDQGATAGGVVAVEPNDPKASAAPSATTPTASAGADTAVAGADQTVTASNDSESGFPWVGVAGLVGLVVLSFVGSRLAMSRRP